MAREKIFPVFRLALAFFILFLLNNSKVYADNWVQDDRGINTFYQNGTPHLSSSGKILNTYGSDSFFPLGIYFADFGPVPDANGNPQGTIWNAFRLDSSRSRNTLPELRAAGFNTVWPFWPVPNMAEMDLANSYGIKVLVHVSDPIRSSVQNNNWQILTDMINRYKNHPATLGWYLDEQNAGQDTPTVLQAQTIINNTDPGRVFMGERSGDRCAPYGNMSNFYLYPIHSSDDNVEGYTDVARVVNLHPECPKPIHAIMQAFRDGGYWTVKPNVTQTHIGIWTSLVSGATGIMFFLQHSPWAWMGTSAVPYTQDTDFSGISPQLTPDLWSVISNDFHFIEANKKIFLSKTSSDEYHLLYDRYGVGLHALLKDTGDNDGVRHLLVAHSSDGGFSAKFQFTYNINRVTSLLDNTPVDIYDSRSFGNYIPGFSVKLYKIETNQFVATPKTCSLSLSSNSINTNQSVTVNFQGNNNGTSSPSAPVELWLEKNNYSQLSGGPGTEVTYTPPGGTTQYFYRQKTCTSTGSTPCSDSVTLSNLPVGNYYLHCDVWNTPNACSGQPACSYYGGPDDCTGVATTCSNSDHTSLTVNNPPNYCTGDNQCADNSSCQGNKCTLLNCGDAQMGGVQCIHSIARNHTCVTVNQPEGTICYNEQDGPRGMCISGVCVYINTSPTPTITPTPTPIPGDYNHNGVIDMDDINFFLTLFSTGNPQGDFNHNGIVDIYDYSYMVGRFGK